MIKQWDYRFGGTGDDLLTCFQQTKDGGYILGGSSRSGIGGDKTQPLWGENDYWIVKLDSLGGQQWDRRFGGTDYDYLFSIVQTIDGGYILGGYSFSGMGGDKSEASWGLYDYWVVKIDSLGIKQWDKRYGGTGQDYLYSLIQTTDRGYILGGWSESGISGDKTQPSWGDTDYWIVKIDSLGVKQWDKRFGGTYYDDLYSLQQTKDGGYILGGWSSSAINGDKTQANWGISDYWMVKTDSLGVKQWDKDFGGSSGDNLYSLQQTVDGGYILGGYSASGISGDKTQTLWGISDYWIIKTDSLGIKQWDKDFGGTDGEDEFENITQTSDGGYLVAGTSYSPISGDKTENNLGLEQSWILKTDSFGNKKWDKTLLTTGHDELGIAIQTKAGCYIVANWTNAGIGGDKTQDPWYSSFDYWIIKFCDTTSVNNSAQVSFNVNDTNLCEKFCTSFTDQSTNNPTAWQWQFSGGDPSSSYLQNPNNICYNIPGVYDVTLITTNPFGNDTLTLHNYITVNPTPPIPTITQTGYTLTSSAANSYQWQLNSVDITGATNQSYTVLQTGYYTVLIGDSNSCKNSTTQYVLIDGIPDVQSDAGISVYPNPSSGNFTVEFSKAASDGMVTIDVLNTLGQKVYSAYESLSSEPFVRGIDLSDFPSGIYFVEIKTDHEFFSMKVLIQE